MKNFNSSHHKIAKKALKPINVTQVIIGTKNTPVLDVGFESDKVGVFVLSEGMIGEAVLSFKLGIIEGV